MRERIRSIAIAMAATAVMAGSAAAQQKPNIVVIMGDDIGMWNIGAYQSRHDGRTDTRPRQARRRRA